uniref:Uncharacterized protein n=1 Tax=Triticum urartu TaxID=4572 RepID=A0A8R7U5F1_TRIUA
MMACRLRLHQLRLVGVRPTCCFPSRNLAAVKSQKIQPPKKMIDCDASIFGTSIISTPLQQHFHTRLQGKSDWMRRALRGINNTVERTSSHGFFRVCMNGIIPVAIKLIKEFVRHGHRDFVLDNYVVECYINTDVHDSLLLLDNMDQVKLR